MKNHAKVSKKTCRKNNSKKAYHLVKELTSSKQGRTTTIQEKAGKCLTQDILKRWKEYYSELYTRTTRGHPKVLDVPHQPTLYNSHTLSCGKK